MSTRQNPNVITVKASTGMSVLWLVAATIFLLTGIMAALLAGAFSIIGSLFLLLLVIGPLFLVIGILSFFKPCCGYDSATGALHLYSALGFQVRAYGSPKNERIYTDPAKARVMRALPNGTHRQVSMVGVNRDDLARLIAALPQHQA